ncbi:MAG: HepT-like ribonuclease domain-containing protein [Candidatus Pacearchaeota archaeon]
MYDIQRVGKILADIDKYLSEIESYKINSASDLSDSKTYNASSMIIFAILNRLIDLGGEIISAENLGAPNSYQDIMNILAKSNIINKSQAEKINFLIKKRNILAHYYGELTERDLFNMLKELKEIPFFVKTIKKRIKI